MKSENFKTETTRQMGNKLAVWIDHMILSTIKRQHPNADLSDEKAVQSRCLWNQYPNGNKVFCMDGVELIVFYPVRFDRVTEDQVTKLTATQDYKILV